MHWIAEQVCLGEYEEAVSPPSEITALLCVAAERRLTSPCRPYHRVAIPESGPATPEQLVDAVAWIRRMVDGGHRVLVFSGNGESRSPSVVIAYLCCELGYPFHEAIETVARVKGPLSLLPDLAASIDSAIGRRCR